MRPSESTKPQVLGIKKTAASNRYVRALKRLKELLAGIRGFDDRSKGS
jgi:hypothetical protein